MTDPRFLTTPWIFGAPDGLSSDLHTAAELEAAWEAMRGRIRELERENETVRDLVVDLGDADLDEPVKHTCPDIDAVHRTIKESIRSLELAASRTVDEEARDEMERVASDLGWDILDKLEEVRAANHELRSWGIRLAKSIHTLLTKTEEARNG